MQPIKILCRKNGINNRITGDMSGQRQFHQDTVDSIIVIQPFHFADQILLSDTCVKTKQGRVEAQLFAMLYFRAYISLACRIITNKYGGKVRLLSAIGLPFNNFLFYLLLY